MKTISSVFDVSGLVGIGGLLTVATIGGQFKTIAQAIAASKAGDVIMVMPGLYTENNPLTMKDSTSIFCPGGHEITTFLCANTGAADHGLVLGSNCEVNGLTVSGASGAGAAGFHVPAGTSHAELHYIGVKTCSYGVQSVSAGPLINVRGLSVDGSVIGTLLRADGAGTLLGATDVFSVGATVTRGVEAVNGGFIEIHNSAFYGWSGGVSDGMYANNGGTIRANLCVISGPTHGLRTGTTAVASIIDGGCLDLLGTGTNDVYIEHASGQVSVAGGGVDSSKVTSVGTFRGYNQENGAAAIGDLTSQQGLVVSKAPGRGLKVDPAAPTFGWRDLIGPIRPKASGAGRPTLRTFRNNWEAFTIAAGDVFNCEFHVPHDYLPGSDIFAHVHWAHVGTAISGNLVLDWYTTYAKGHNQASFPAEVNYTQTIPTPNIATVPQWEHRIDEFQLSASTPGPGQIDTDDLEVDGLIGIQVDATTIPTISGGTTTEPFILFVDIHYQSTGIPTKQKAPNFYV